MSGQHLELRLLEGRFSVCRLPPGEGVPAWASCGTFFSVTRRGDELSVVCAETAVPDGIRHEAGWCIFEIEGPLDFSLTGILASVLEPLAAAAVSVFALSTFNTDYVMVKEDRVETAVAALAAAGHRVKRL